MSSRYPVKFFSILQRGAPVLNGTPGSFIELLRKCLVQGFGEVTALSATIQDGWCTINFNDQESFEIRRVVEVSGANVTSINGEQRVEESTPTSIRFKTLESNQPVTGTIKVKYAPVGDWTIPFEGVNEAVFKSSNTNSSETYFHVDDRGAYCALITAYKKMGSLNNGYVSTPKKNVGPITVFKSIQANTNRVWWDLFGDYAGFYFFVSRNEATNSSNIGIINYNSDNRYNAITADYYFGDYKPEGFQRKQTGMVLGPRNNTIKQGNGIFYVEGNIFGYWTKNGEYCEDYLVEDPITGEGGYKVKHIPLNAPMLSGYESLWSGHVFYKYSYHPITKLISVGDYSIITPDGMKLGQLPGVYRFNNAMFDSKEKASSSYLKEIDVFINQVPKKLLMLPRAYSTSSYAEGVGSIAMGAIDYVGPWR